MPRIKKTTRPTHPEENDVSTTEAQFLCPFTGVNSAGFVPEIENETTIKRDSNDYQLSPRE
jgi:hypothetical protein